MDSSNVPGTDDAVAAQEADDVDPSLDAWRLPISLRIVAFVFVLFGILSVVDVILRWLLLGQVFVNLGCLFVFIGWGLRRWSEAARGCAVFLTWATLVLLLFWAVLASYVAVGGVLPPNTHVSGVNLSGVLFGTVATSYCMWQLWVLKRPDIVWRFQNLRVAPRIHRPKGVWWNPRDWRFSLESLLLATTVIAFVIVDVQSRELWWSDSFGSQHSRSADGKEQRRADYIVARHRVFERPEQLYCLLLTRGDEAKHGTSYRTIGSGDRITVHFDNGTEEELTITGRQLYQIDNGQLRSIAERVTKAEFDRFTASQPADWSIEALVEFAKAERGKPIDIQLQN